MLKLRGGGARPASLDFGCKGGLPRLSHLTSMPPDAIMHQLKYSTIVRLRCRLPTTNTLPASEIASTAFLTVAVAWCDVGA